MGNPIGELLRFPIVQTIGTEPKKVISQKVVTEEQYQEFLKADITISQSTGTSTTAVMSQKATTDAIGGRVPTSRKVNGKALTGDITLVAGDVGAYAKSETYTKTETDGKITTAIDAQPKLLSGAGVPAVSLGKVGDWYIQY